MLTPAEHAHPCAEVQARDVGARNSAAIGLATGWLVGGQRREVRCAPSRLTPPATSWSRLHRRGARRRRRQRSARCAV